VCSAELPVLTVSNIKIITLHKNVLWKISVSSNNETCFGLHIKSQYFCPVLSNFGVSQPIFIKVPIVKFHENPSSGSCDNTCVQTDGRDEANRHFLYLWECA
jgi:hypothetical protein